MVIDRNYIVINRAECYSDELCCIDADKPLRATSKEIQVVEFTIVTSNVAILPKAGLSTDSVRFFLDPAVLQIALVFLQLSLAAENSTRKKITEFLQFLTKTKSRT